MAKLPLDVLEKAGTVSRTLESMAEEGRTKSIGTGITLRRKTLLQVRPLFLSLRGWRLRRNNIAEIGSSGFILDD